MKNKFRVRIPKKKKRSKILVYGAGVAGKLALEEIKRYREKDYEVVGFLDDDEKKWTKKIYGKKVLGGIEFLKKIRTTKLSVDEVLIAIPSAPSDVVRKIVGVCEDVKLSYKILPGVYDIITGKTQISSVREVRIEDILGRGPVKVNYTKISSLLNGKTVLIAGAAGSIGSEIARQLIKFNIGNLILFDQNESGLYDVCMEFINRSSDKEVVPILGDIKDQNKLDRVFKFLTKVIKFFLLFFV